MLFNFAAKLQKKIHIRKKKEKNERSQVNKVSFSKKNRQIIVFFD